ncbi:MAG: hypothetical protein HY513_02645 [Candidatus Aenigmarchaeota archaeon]|nr:hypothetical protein [Candidatus Aenigmarchaeota archaeon]
MKEVVHILSLATMLAMTMIVFLTFVVAYASPSKSAFVLINELGEADMELMLLSFLLLLNAATTITLSRGIYISRRERQILQKLRFMRRNKKYFREMAKIKPYYVRYEN